jgi:hypothetical protein
MPTSTLVTPKACLSSPGQPLPPCPVLALLLYPVLQGPLGGLQQLHSICTHVTGLVTHGSLDRVPCLQLPCVDSAPASCTLVPVPSSNVCMHVSQALRILIALSKHNALPLPCCSLVPAREPSHRGPGGAVRPVVQAAQDACGQRVVLTRVDPADPASSVLLRVRPGWERLRQMLNGEEFVRHFKEPKPKPKKRCVECSLGVQHVGHAVGGPASPASGSRGAMLLAAGAWCLRLQRQRYDLRTRA